MKQLHFNLFKKHHGEFIPDPNFQTPKEVCQYMAGLIPKKAKIVLEPTPGLGNMVRAIKKKGFKVIAADDFFLLDNSIRYDAICMNPPFSAKSAYTENVPPGSDTKGMKLGYYILLECMKMSDNVVALMPWFTLSDSDIRLKHLKDYGIKSITTLPRKTFKYARVQTVVIELEKGFKGETIFKTFFY